SGLTDLSLTLLDVLTGIETLKICVAYKLDGKTITEFPASLKDLARCEPVYEELPGWTEDITGVTSLDDLPVN
ncbi:adenylosuccinate synthetase, partial [Escherichia coli]|nr:adenylosuccinate synthetase [Escherichia coli]